MPEGWLSGPQTSALTRIPPSNIQAEQALLGAILTNNKAYESVGEFLQSEHFVDRIHGRIYQAAQERIEAGRPVDPLILKNYFESKGEIEAIGGQAYLVQLVSAMVGIVNASEYGKVVYETWLRRQLVEIGQELVNSGFSGAEEVAEVAANFATVLDQITVGKDRHKPTFLGDAVLSAIQAGLDAQKGLGGSGVRSGLNSLDGIFGDLEPGGVYIIGGRPGDGKSALGLQIALHNALRKVPVCYYSTEMQAKQLGRRAAAHLTGVPVKAIKRGDWTTRQYDSLQQTYINLNSVNELFSIDDAPGLNMKFISSRARSFARQQVERAKKAFDAARRKAESEGRPAPDTHRSPVGLVVVDHIHDLSEMSEQEMKAAIGSITRSAKNLAKNLGWPVILLAQLKRPADERDPRPPTMADLYGGMQIEAIAEGIVLLHRPEKALDPNEPSPKQTETDVKFQERFETWKRDWDRLRGIVRGYIPKVRDDASGQVLNWEFDGARNKFADEGAAQGVPAPRAAY